MVMEAAPKLENAICILFSNFHIWWAADTLTDSHLNRCIREPTNMRIPVPMSSLSYPRQLLPLIKKNIVDPFRSITYIYFQTNYGSKR
jgi:hypothetical protein